MSKIPVTILTGFLGSGKTTLLSQALQHPDFRESALIVNEFGKISIDHLLVADLAENIIELRDGCLCCSIRGDLVMTLRDLHRKSYLDEIPKFKRVIVETTGIADPIPLIHTLMANKPIMSVYALDAVVTVVDGVSAGSMLSEHESAANQVALGDILIISKTDLITSDEAKRLAALLRSRNLSAEILNSAQGDIEPKLILDRGLFQPDYLKGQKDGWFGKIPEGTAHSDEYVTHAIHYGKPLSLAGTSVFLNRIVNELGDQILRIKGLAEFKQKPGSVGVVHAVQNKFYPILWMDHWPDEDHSSRFVFIGRNLDIERINELFSSLCID